MLYGFIYRLKWGAYQIRVDGFDRMNYIYYTKREAVARYRAQNNLQYKHILFFDYSKKGVK